MANTFSSPSGKTWNEAVNGAAVSRVGIQVVTTYPVDVCIATTAPAENAQDYMVLSWNGTRELVCSLDAADKIYIRTTSVVEVAVRGYREARA